MDQFVVCLSLDFAVPPKFNCADKPLLSAIPPTPPPTVLLETVLVTKVRALYAEPSVSSRSWWNTHFLQLGHSSLDASFSPQPAQVVVVIALRWLYEGV